MHFTVNDVPEWSTKEPDGAAALLRGGFWKTDSIPIGGANVRPKFKTFAEAYSAAYHVRTTRQTNVDFTRRTLPCVVEVIWLCNIYGCVIYAVV